MAHAITVALAGKIEDSKHLINEGAQAADFSFDLDKFCEKLNALSPVNIPVEQVVAAAQEVIAEADAHDTTPGDGIFEAGFKKLYKLRAKILGFITVGDDVGVEGGLVVKAE